MRRTCLHASSYHTQKGNTLSHMACTRCSVGRLPVAGDRCTWRARRVTDEADGAHRTYRPCHQALPMQTRRRHPDPRQRYRRRKHLPSRHTQEERKRKRLCLLKTAVTTTGRQNCAMQPPWRSGGRLTAERSSQVDTWVRPRAITRARRATWTAERMSPSRMRARALSALRGSSCGRRCSARGSALASSRSCCRRAM